MAGETVTGAFMAAPERDVTTVSNLDLASVEVETDALWAEEEMADRSVVETSQAGESFQEEFNGSPSEPSWSSGMREEQRLSAGASSSLVTPALLPVTVNGESDATGAFASLPQAWVSPGIGTRPSGQRDEQEIPAMSLTSAMFMNTGFATVSSQGDIFGGLNDIVTTTESDSGDRRDGLNDRLPGTNSPAEYEASGTPRTSYSSPQLPQFLPANTVFTGAVATVTTGSDAASSEGLPITGGKGAGFTMTDPDRLYSLEATSKMEEPGLNPQGSGGTKPTTAREETRATTQ
ncbi:hypothetical protein scyTo_0009835, partial [Scyliorhinus torazame]|nr:hypothetical protein [Scyliorhinus torazame]